MKLRCMFSLLVLSLLVTANSAWAVDVQNMDNKKYDVKFTATNGTSTLSSTIDGNTTIANFFAGDGSLEVVGVGTIQVGADDVVEIKNGKLSKRTS